ncbi:MAG: alkylmercury lyase family protein [Actinomycetota bacterium]|nr:alkylmercury lyase family protein [Actinomycetota bacterium]
MPINIDVLDTQHSGLDDAFRRHAFEQLRCSGPVAASDLVASSPSGAEAARRTLDELVERGMAIVEHDKLVAIDGLSLRPTQHRMRIGDDALFTWCAADAIGIPAALSEVGEVITACPHCSAEIVVPIQAGLPQANEDLVLWLPTANCSQVVTQFCPDVNLFCNHDHLDAWRSLAGDPEGETLSADEAAELGRQWWAYLIGARDD